MIWENSGMKKKIHWSQAKDAEEMCKLMIEEGYKLFLICQVTAKSEQFVYHVAEKYELEIRREYHLSDKLLHAKNM